MELNKVNEVCRLVARSLVAEIGPWGERCAFIGGLIPGLLVADPNDDLAPHIGTRDVDLALRVAALGEDREMYRTLKQNLANLGLQQNSARSFEWGRKIEGVDIVVELFVPVDAPIEGGKIQKKPIEQSGSGLTALGVFGLDLLERDLVVIEDTGPLLDGKGIKRVPLRVCGPAILLSLKAWALHDRTKTKDGYDVVWMLKAQGVETIAARFRDAKFQETSFGATALDHLTENFSSPAHTGPQGWVTESRFTGDEAAREARDAVGLVREFVGACRE